MDKVGLTILLFILGVLGLILLPVVSNEFREPDVLCIVTKIGAPNRYGEYSTQLKCPPYATLVASSIKFPEIGAIYVCKTGNIKHGIC